MAGNIKLGREQFTNVIDSIRGIDLLHFVEVKDFSIIFPIAEKEISHLRFATSTISQRAKWVSQILKDNHVNGEYIITIFVDAWPDPFARVILSSDMLWVEPLVATQQKSFSLLFIRPDNKICFGFRLYEGNIEAYTKPA